MEGVFVYAMLISFRLLLMRPLSCGMFSNQMICESFLCSKQQEEFKSIYIYFRFDNEELAAV